MYFYELSQDIGPQVDNATVGHLDALWQRYRDAHGTLPRFADLSPERLDWCAPDLMVVEPVAADDFRYLHYGANIAAASGFDMTDRLASEFRSEVGQFFRDKYRDVIRMANRLALHAEDGAQFASKQH